MRSCPACGLQQEHSYSYCKKCGAPLDHPPAASPPPSNLARVCSGCGTEQQHSHSFCKKCGAPLPSAAISAPVGGPEPATVVRVCPDCGMEQHHEHPFCKKCGAALPGTTTPALGKSVPRCPVCRAIKEPSWHVCEQCGAGAARKQQPHRILWVIAFSGFTAIWAIALVTWWYFSYRLTLGPVVPGSIVEIDGKIVATLGSAVEEYASPRLPRGRHSLAVKCPGRLLREFDFRVGWAGLRRHFAIVQVPEVACIVVTGVPNPTVDVGSKWPTERTPNEFCAPVGTKAFAEWRPDATQEPIRQPFEYANDGQVVALAYSGPLPEQISSQAAALSPQPAAIKAGAASPPTPAVNGRPVGELLQTARVLFGRREYKAALASCNQALEQDPGNRAARALQTKIRQTMEVLGIQ